MQVKTTYKRFNFDFYPTPPSCVEAIYKHIDKNMIVPNELTHKRLTNYQNIMVGMLRPIQTFSHFHAFIMRQEMLGIMKSPTLGTT